MECRHILRKIFERGSDELATALYERLRADRVAIPGVKGAPGELPPVPTWRELAMRAVNERTLTTEEAIPLVQDDGRRRASGSRRIRNRLAP